MPASARGGLGPAGEGIATRAGSPSPPGRWHTFPPGGQGCVARLSAMQTDRAWEGYGVPGVLLAATAALLALGVLDVVGAIAVAAATLLCVAWRKATPVGADPQRQARVELARARREDRGADVLVARLERASRAGARELASSLRLTDGVSVSRRGRAWELCAVISKENARAAIERRLAAAYGDRLRVSWARFPA